MKSLAKIAVLPLFANAVAVAQPWQLPISDYGGAKPRNLGSWYSYDDYPDAAVKAGEQGYVTVAFTIGIDGRMGDCTVIRSSGYPTLDAIPCKVLTKRARFTPAKGPSGAPIVTHGRTSMAFWNRP
jgi:TonB family protein